MSTISTSTASAERAAAILTALRECQNNINQLFARLSPPDLALSTVCIGWSVRDQIGHLIDATELLTRCVEQSDTGLQEGTYRPRAMAAAMQSGAVERAALLPLAQLQLTFNQAADRFLHLLDGRDAAWWDQQVPHPYLGTCAGLQIAGMALVDWFIHPWDIREALGQAQSPRSDHAFLLVQGLISLMPRRLDPQRVRGMRGRFRYLIRSDTGYKTYLVARLDLVLKDGEVKVERDAPDSLPADLTFEGGAVDLALGMLGRRGMSKLALPGPANETWLSRWPNMWISL